MRPTAPEADAEQPLAADFHRPGVSASSSTHTLHAVLSATVITTAGLIGGMALGALRQVLAARVLGPEGYGLIGIAESFENVLIRVAPLGLTMSVPLLLSRAVADRNRAEAGAALGTAALLAIPLALAPGLLLAVFAEQAAALLGLPDVSSVLRIWSLVVVGLTLCHLASAAPRGLLQMGTATVLRDVLPNALLLGGLGTALMAGLTLPQVAGGYAAGALAAGVIAAFVAMRIVRASRIQPAIRTSSITPLLRLTWPALTMVVAGQLMRQINIPILTVAADVRDVGIFTTALFLATTTEAIFTSLTMVYMPYANRLLVEGGLPAVAAIQSAIGRWTFAVSVIPIGILSAFAEPIIGLVFGAEYMPAAGPLRIILIGLLVRAIVGPRESVQLALGRARDVSVAFIFALAAAVLVALVLTPPLGMLGSALSFAAGFGVRAIVSELQLRRELPAAAMQAREIVTASTVLLFVVAACVPATPLAWLLPLLAPMATLAIFRATLDHTDREMLSLVLRKAR